MNLRNYVAAGLIAFMALFSSCTEEVIERGDTIIYEGGNADIIRLPNLDAPNKDWQWNEETKKYQIFFEIPELDADVFDNAAIIAYLYHIDGSVMLPFIQTQVGDKEDYTRILSYDMIDNEIAFFIQDSNNKKNPFLDGYEFKVIIVKEKNRK